MREASNIAKKKKTDERKNARRIWLIALLNAFYLLLNVNAPIRLRLGLLHLLLVLLTN